MLSNGGFTNVEEAKRNPVQLLESGPAAGALAAAHLGAEDGGQHVLAFDMGGTTAKLSVVEDGAPRLAYSFEAARAKRFIEGSGLPLRISTLELIEIGAGGGSIAHTDNLDLLKVGPISAGSSPGPGVLWKRWRTGYGNGCQPGARVSQSGLFRRRHDKRFSRSCRGGTTATGRTCRCRSASHRMGRARHRQREHGERGSCPHCRARQGSSRLQHVGDRRRWTFARILCRQEARVEAPDRAAVRRCCVCSWSAHRASTRRPRDNAGGGTFDNRLERIGGQLPGAYARRDSAFWPRPGSMASRPISVGRRTSDTVVRPSNLSFRCHQARTRGKAMTYWSRSSSAATSQHSPARHRPARWRSSTCEYRRHWNPPIS